MKQEIFKELGESRVKIDEPMREHVHMKVGGPADFYYEASNSEELARSVKVAIRSKTPYVVIGNGANVLVSDNGIRGLVIQNHSKNMRFLPHGFVEIDSGVDNTDLILAAKNRNLTGMERLLKVPGTVGGAIYMNAGDTGKKRFFGDLVIWVEVIDAQARLSKLRKEDCDFDYRSSRFQRTGEIILRAKIELKKSTTEELEEAAKDILIRKSYHPSGATLGSTFKNPESGYAGKLIEEVGLKGRRIGGAKISEKHANFIINDGNATAGDVKALIDLMKRAVKERSNINLEEEVRYLGDW